MFGLENQKSKKAEEFNFELEKEFQNKPQRQAIIHRIEGKLQKVKEILRSGEDKENFDHLGKLLHGYNSLLKVMSRFSLKS